MNEVLGISAGIGLSVIVYLIAGAVLFLLIGIVSVVICANKKLFKRHHQIWNFTAKIYFLYIPLVFGTFGGILGGLYGLKQSVMQNIDKHSSLLVESSRIYMPEFQYFINQNIDSLQIAGFSADGLVDKFFNKDTLVGEKGFVASFENKLGKMVFKGIIEGLIDYSAYKVGVKQSTLKGTLENLSEFDYKNADKSVTKVILKTIKKQVHALFNGFYISQLINLLLFLSIPIIETIVYFGFVKNKIPSNEVRAG